ncbi:MAG: L-serine ammonia-lyase [Candidatus Brocadiae bacterium]|nr:L-serine ammonia-lyase [Candidatus Brocadiia bacterium]
MESILEIFKIGYGPSSSHTMGPKKAAELFRMAYPDASGYRVTLYGSLAATGKGHLTDKAILAALNPISVELVWESKTFLPFHPNALKLEALDNKQDVLGTKTIYSTGGGTIVEENESVEKHSIYPLGTMKAILGWCQSNGRQFWEYIQEYEKPEIWDYLYEVWKVMKDAVERGIEEEGVLPGPLKLGRKSASYYAKAKGFRGALKRRSMLYAFALGVAEENAGGGKIVTAPTCGSSGVLPSVLYLLHKYNEFTEKKILKSLATAALIGNLVKRNASIAGADVGCQGEIGTACAMASAAAAQLFGATPAQIEYAAEMGIEHHLGLTCDPIGGLVQIPCIERNPLAAGRALDCCTFAILSDGHHRISFDQVVCAMKQTGHDLPHIYKETSLGGLAILE